MFHKSVILFGEAEEGTSDFSFVFNFHDTVISPTFSSYFSLQEECQNHVRIVAKLSEELLLICGTHAYRPKCRHYSFQVKHFSMKMKINNNGILFYQNACYF